MKIPSLLIALFFLLPASLRGQDFCRGILVEAWQALENQDSLPLILDMLQAAETCDYEDALLEGPKGRQALEKAIFEAINAQKVEAEVAKERAINQQRIAERERAIAQRRAREAKSAALAAKAQELLAEDPTVALNLAMAAYDTATTPQAAAAMAAVLRNPATVFYTSRKQMPVRNYLRNFEDIIDEATDDEDEIDVSLSFVSPDGSIMVLPGKRDTTWVLEVETNQPLFFLEELYIQAGEVLFSPDAASLLTCKLEDESCKLWDLRKDEIGSLQKSWEDVESAAFSPSGSKLALLTDKTIKVWDKASGEVEAHGLEGDTLDIGKMAISDDGEKLLVYDKNQDSIVVWKLPERTVLARYSGADQHLSFSPDGNQFMTTSGDSLLMLKTDQSDTSLILDNVLAELTPTEQERVEKLKEDGDMEFWFEPTLLSARFSPDGARIITLVRRMMMSYEVKIWDASTGKELSELKGLKGMTYSADFSPDGARAVTNSGLFVMAAEEEVPYIEPEVVHWDLERWHQPGRKLEGFPTRIRDLVFFPNTNRFITLPAYEAPQVWDAQTGQTYAGGSENRSGRMMYAANANARSGADTLWQIAANGERSRQPLRGGSVYRSDVSSDGAVIAGGGTSGKLYLWHSHSPEAPYQTIDAHGDYINRVVIAPDNKKVITAADDGWVKIWNIRSGEKLAEWQVDSGRENTTVDISPDGKSLAVASEEGTVKLLDIAGRKEPLVWRPLDNSFDVGRIFPALAGTPFIQGRVNAARVEVNCVRFSNSGERLLIASAEDDSDRYLIKVWDIPTKTLLFSLEGHEDPIIAATFSPDDTRIITTDGDNDIFIWTDPVGSFRAGRYYEVKN